MDGEKALLRGIAEKLHTGSARLKWNEGEKNLDGDDHTHALFEISHLLPKTSLHAIGHRVVHGGEKFNRAVLIDKKVERSIEACSDLAPLHNPINLLGIRYFAEISPDVAQVAVFDTAFHQTLPPRAYLYALPLRYSKEFGIRRYGFHGTSHKYVSIEAANLLQKPLEECRFISCHLGNGCSIAAIRGGKSIDTSMGFTPLEGLVMGERTGDLDASIPLFLAEKLGIEVEEVIEICNKESGLLGLSEISCDMRELLECGDSRAEVAIELFCYRLAKYIASYLVPLEWVDAVIFTGGIGENAAAIRERVMQQLRPFNLRPLVIATNEELMIAREALQIANRAKKGGS